MKHPEKFSLRKRGDSFSHALRGLIYLVKNEHNARIHVAILVIAIVIGVLLKITPAEWIAIAIVSGMVLISELVNSAIENLADIIEPEWNSRIKLIKDYSAAAVLVSSVISAITGGVIFLPRIFLIIKSI